MFTSCQNFSSHFCCLSENFQYRLKRLFFIFTFFLCTVVIWYGVFVLVELMHFYVLAHVFLARVPAHVFPHTFSRTRVPAHVFPHTFSRTRVSAHVFPHTGSRTRIPAKRVPANVFPHTCSRTRVPSREFPHTYFRTRVPAHVFWLDSACL